MVLVQFFQHVRTFITVHLHTFLSVTKLNVSLHLIERNWQRHVIFLSWQCLLGEPISVIVANVMYLSPQISPLSMFIHLSFLFDDYNVIMNDEIMAHNYKKHTQKVPT